MNPNSIKGSPTPKKFKFAYPGSFDPFTKGHLSVVTSFLSKDPDAGMEIVIGHNSSKKGTFSAAERKFIIEQSIPPHLRARVKVTIVEGIIANYMYAHSIPYFIKGLRDLTDYQYEFNLAQLNSQFPGSPMTLFVPQTDSSLNAVSSSNLKLLTNLGIPLEKYAPGFVREAIKLKTTGKMFIGVVGGIASGKSTFCRELAEFAKDRDLAIYHVNMDTFTHIVQTETKNVLPLFTKVRRELVDLFGESIMNPDGTINRKILGEIVFNDKEKLDLLTARMLEPVLFLMSEEINSFGPGIVLIESAILLDRNISELVDDNIIHVHVSQETQLDRMIKFRGLTEKQALRRLRAQLTEAEIQARVEAIQSQDFNRLFIKTDSAVAFDLESVYQRLEREYCFRVNTRVYGDLFIPSEISFANEQHYIHLLHRMYDSKGRRYHNPRHIGEMLTGYQKIKHLLKNPTEVYMAIIFHDIIYKIGHQTNEEESARFAVKFLSKHLLEPENIDLRLLEKLINLTKLHGKEALEKQDLTEDERLFLDLDMAILGAASERFMEYEKEIELEYAVLYPYDAYKNGRLEFLKAVKAKSIYLSEYYKTRLEVKAKQNINLLIAQLEMI